MMREILFRGKTKEGEWVEGGVLQFHDYTAICAYNDYHEWHDFIEVVPETVGQYTGLNDKNGTKIFEGDVVRCHCLNRFLVRKVVFDQYTAEFRMRDIYGCHKIYDPLLCEVLGNVHDNPELFKGGLAE